MPRSVAALVALFTLAASPAFAGIADPLPTLGGESSIHLYSFAGPLNLGQLRTLVTCTSAETSQAAMVGVQIFDVNNVSLNDVSVGNGAVSIGPGKTAFFCVGGTIATTLCNSNVAWPIQFAGASAGRILSTSKKIVCSVIALDYTNTPPTSMVSLPLVAKTKQKGD